jgi:hypothetical protein
MTCAAFVVQQMGVVNVAVQAYNVAAKERGLKPCDTLAMEEAIAAALSLSDLLAER